MIAKLIIGATLVAIVALIVWAANLDKDDLIQWFDNDEDDE